MDSELAGVIATNDDAAQCKAYAVERHYWTDPYIRYFASRNRATKAPEINRGYYARVKAIEILIGQLCQQYSENLQIVNLGAGYDTLFWRLADGGVRIRKFVEVDFPQVVKKKIDTINRVPSLSSYFIEPITKEQNSLHSKHYDIISGDLTKCDQLVSDLSGCSLSPDLPTVFLAECVLVYIDVSLSNTLLSHIGSTFKSAYFINYEQVKLNDRFGQVMIENLKHRNCVLYGVDACQSLETQRERFLNHGWKYAKCETMLTIYQSLPLQDIQRMIRLEFLDEVELLDQLLDHYCITWSANYLSDTFDKLSFNVNPSQ